MKPKLPTRSEPRHVRGVGHVYCRLPDLVTVEGRRIGSVSVAGVKPAPGLGGGEACSLMDTFADVPELLRPQVGMGATLHVGADDYPLTIIEVSRSGKRIRCQRDRVRGRRAAGSDLSVPASYLFIPDPEGEIIEVSLRQNGYWRPKGRACSGRHVTIGERHCYRDPHV